MKKTKRTLTALFLCVCLLASTSVTAFAADETSASTALTYTKEAPEVCTYTIDIPKSITLNEDCMTIIQVFAENVQIPDSKQVVVTLDPSTFTGGACYIYSNKGTDSESRISLNLSANDQYLSGGEVIATFQNGVTNKTEGGRINVSSTSYKDAAAGTYTGAINFSIEVQDK